MKDTFLRAALILIPILSFAKDFGREGTVFPIIETCTRNKPEGTISECRFKRSYTVIPTQPFPEKLKEWLDFPDDGLLFLHGCKRKHIQWAHSQRGEFTRVVVKGCPYEFGQWTRYRIYKDFDHSLCEAFGVKHIPCRVTTLEEGFLVEEIPVHEPVLSVCISFSMPDETILLLSKELEQYGGTFRLQSIPNNSEVEITEKVGSLRELGVNSRFVIDPEMFEVLGITEVPAYVITGPNGVDKISGNSSIRGFLENVSLTGENAEFATKRLETQFP